MSQFLQPYDEQQFQGLFQKAFVDPAMMQYEQSVLPSIREGMMGMDEDASSSLNQALAASAKDLATGMGTQMGQFYQGERANQMQAVQTLMSLLGVKGTEPIVTQRPSALQQIGGVVGAAAPWYMGRR